MIRPIAAPAALRAKDLRTGARGMVSAVEGEDGIVERLASMGIVPGTRFRVMRDGSPLAIAVGETRLALGPDWAHALVVVSV